MRTFGKCVLLLVYALALAGWAGLLPPRPTIALQAIALLALAIHALELAFVFGRVRRRAGGPTLNAVQVLLFGVLHWMPLARRP
jgi:uncharacterized protein YhhL (DUF1145 family)